MKILVIRFSSLGDILMTTAMVRTLKKRFPQSEIHFAVREDFKDLVQWNPHLKKVWTIHRSEGIPGLLRLRKSWNEENFDLIYDAHRSLRTRLLMPFLKAKEKAYFMKHYFTRSLALTFKLPLLPKKRFLVQFMEPLYRCGVKDDNLGPELCLPDSARESAQQKFPLKTLTDKKRIGLIPSAQWPGKRWPLDYFRTLIEILVQKTPHEFVIFGGKEDVFCEDLARGFSTERVINTQGKLSIAESSALVEKCDLVVANDTGLMHVADSLGIPSVLILGPTSGDLGCLPFHPLSQIVEKQMWCRPCSKNGEAPCIRGKRHCLLELSPQMVFDSTMKLVALCK